MAAGFFAAGFFAVVLFALALAGAFAAVLALVLAAGFAADFAGAFFAFAGVLAINSSPSGFNPNRFGQNRACAIIFDLLTCIPIQRAADWGFAPAVLLEIIIFQTLEEVTSN
ncbi:MAG: hypothetical protein KJZ80_17950 [Hyphomicrobiaceae bacterium]|nr:hypothetical protein [Hyphomicrobiaceae bacterium]